MRGAEELLIIVVFTLALAMPVVSLVLAIAAFLRAGRLKRTVRELQRQIADLKDEPAPRNLGGVNVSVARNGRGGED